MIPKLKKVAFLITAMHFLAIHIVNAGDAQLPVSATLTTELLGESKSTATNCVYRIIRKDGGVGTGFLHHSGNVITAAHVVGGATAQEIIIFTPTGQQIAITNIAQDTNLDIAVLYPAAPITGLSFAISTNKSVPLGTPVLTWGYPAGYTGLQPLLISGSVSGEQLLYKGGTNFHQMVVNAAFNSGNSGGPLLDLETRTVIGVVVSKLAPMPPYVEKEIAALKSASSGVGYNLTDNNGKVVKTIVEAQVLADVIEYLRGQVQLVIGYAVPAEDLRNFLKAQGIDP